MEAIEERERELREKIAQWSNEMEQLENQLDALYNSGEPLSSAEMVRISSALTSLRLKLMKLDQEYEDFILSSV